MTQDELDQLLTRWTAFKEGVRLALVRAGSTTLTGIHNEKDHLKVLNQFVEEFIDLKFRMKGLEK